ncbi:MAG: sodium-dependent transporter [Methanomicrobiales archaeon]|nr:sodium-dependent transporter [Methanomicrobiales archaeon]
MEQWSSRLGFLLAAIGSAVGIGNIWRFPSVVGQNGGGAYLIPYFLAVFLCGVPLLALEMAAGRHYRGDVVTVFHSVRDRFRIIGWFICVIVFLILSYYLVITGWTLAYLFFAATGSTVSFAGFTGSPLPLLFFLLSALFTGGIISLGVRQGIERITTVLLPLIYLILGMMVVYGITLPGFAEGIAYFLTPDFSVLGDPLIWSAAVGQAFFSLSVGYGILITYGAYLDRRIRIGRSSLIIAAADTMASMLAGLVIFPLVFTFGLEPAVGAQLAFTTLPRAFAQMPFGRVFAVAFFFLLFAAAITSAISMLEVGVTSVVGSSKLSRRRVTLLLTALVILLGLPSALSYTGVALSVGGVRILDLLDETVGTIALPVTALLIAVVFTWYAGKGLLEEEMGSEPGWLKVVYPITKYLAPVVLVVITIAWIINTLGIQLQGSTTVLLLSALVLVAALLCGFTECRLPDRE